MIIKLTGADASANNLGTVDVVNLEQETVNLLRKMTKYSKYSNEALQVNNVIASLKTAELWSKIQLFYVPWMAANVDEMKYNPQGVELTQDVANNLYYDDGELYARTIGGDMRGACFTFPQVDVRNKFVAGTALSNTGFTNINFDVIFLNVGSPTAGIGGTYSWAGYIGASGSKGNVLQFDSSFTGVNTSETSKFTVNNNTPTVTGSPSTKTETALKNIMIANYVGSGSNIKLTQNKNIYIIGNTSLSSSEITTLKDILNTYCNNI